MISRPPNDNHNTNRNRKTDDGGVTHDKRNDNINEKCHPELAVDTGLGIAPQAIPSPGKRSPYRHCMRIGAAQQSQTHTRLINSSIPGSGQAVLTSSKRKPSRSMGAITGPGFTGLGTSPTFSCGQTVRSSMLAFETNDLIDESPESGSLSNVVMARGGHVPPNADPGSTLIRSQLSFADSSSEDEFTGGYDSDDRMSIASRRASIVTKHPYSPLLDATIPNRETNRLLKDSADGILDVPAYRQKIVPSRNYSMPNQSSQRGLDGNDYLGPHGNVDKSNNIASSNGDSDSRLANIPHKVSMRQSGLSARLRPKLKSFMRVSQDLQDEMAPLDCEMQREADLTSCFRRLDSSSSLRYLNEYDEPRDKGESIFNFEEEDATNQAKPHEIHNYSGARATLSTNCSAPLIHPNKELLVRLQHLKTRRLSTSALSSKDKSFTSDTENEGNPTFKRKIDFVDDVMDNNYSSLKRRAVSPGVSSPLLTGSPTHIGKIASLRQLSDTSEGFQKMSL